MGSAYRDVHAGFSNFKAAETVDDGDAMDGEIFVEMRGDLLNLGQGHGLVSLVFEIEGAAVLGMVADASVKDDDGAIGIPANEGCQCERVYGFVNNRDYIRGRGGHGYTSAATYGGQEGNFITSRKGSVPGREFLITGGD